MNHQKLAKGDAVRVRFNGKQGQVVDVLVFNGSRTCKVWHEDDNRLHAYLEAALEKVE